MTKARCLPLSELTSVGEAAFRQLLADAPGLDIAALEERIQNIASQPATARVIPNPVDVPLFPRLRTRQETALLTERILNDAGIDAGPTTGSESTFSWLALVFLPAICKRNGAGNAVGGRMYRYLLTRSTWNFYRHLVACPFWLHRKHGKHARIFLCQDACIVLSAGPDIIFFEFLRAATGA